MFYFTKCFQASSIVHKCSENYPENVYIRFDVLLVPLFLIFSFFFLPFLLSFIPSSFFPFSLLSFFLSFSSLFLFSFFFLSLQFIMHNSMTVDRTRWFSISNECDTIGDVPYLLQSCIQVMTDELRPKTRSLSLSNMSFCDFSSLTRKLWYACNCATQQNTPLSVRMPFLVLLYSG